ncbi:MAG: lamin tail domain-containing protein [candidate division Zixibacteria bacterium]|nr:lamin tail domain-containing protein [candidate division Zixibacteria bacterium]
MNDNLLKHSIIFFYFFFSFVLNLILAQAGLSQENISSTPNVIFNEILANEPGSNTKLEWVELFNTDSIDHDLGGWFFISKDYMTEISGGTIIPSGGFLIIARKLVSEPPDSISFEGYWGDASGVWGDSELEDFPAIEAKMSLTNSGGTVSLIDPDNIKRSFTWDEDCGDGVSLEKISPETTERSENWSCCIHPDKSTPGKINSVAPAENDLSIKSEELFSSPPIPLEDSSFSIIAIVRNAGTAKSLANEIAFFNDRNWDEVLEEDERLADLIMIPPLEVGEADTISIEVNFPKGNYRIHAKIGEDEKDFNNQAFVNLKVRGTLPDVVINEFMCSPDLSLSQTEWVELYNRSDNSISIKNWLLGDSVEQNLITPDEAIIEPKGFLIITQDKDEFRATYSEVGCEVIEQESWQSLNNTGDKVILKDSLNLSEDEVSYQQISAEKGISWERIDYDLPASDEGNWWKCTDPVGATPGKENSLHTHYSDKIDLSITPNPFSPDGDGFEDEVTFHYVLPKMSELTLKVYDIKGRVVKTLIEDEPQVTGKITWDGKDDKNRIVRIGIYIVLAEAKGITNSVKKMTLVVAKR